MKLGGMQQGKQTETELPAVWKRITLRQAPRSSERLPGAQAKIEEQRGSSQHAGPTVLPGAAFSDAVFPRPSGQGPRRRAKRD